MGILRNIFSEAKTLTNSAKSIYLNRAAISQLSPREMLNRSLNNYKENLETKTKILTTCGTIGVTYLLGEAIAQTINGDFDPGRIATVWLYGTALGGPAYYAWFQYLDKLPGQILVNTNKYKEMVVQKLPKMIGNYVSMKTSRNLVVDSLTQMETVIGKDSNGKDIILPSNSPMKVYIPENTSVSVSAFTFETKRIEKINKWVIKASKVLADQLVFSSGYTLFLITATGFMTGKDMVAIAHIIQSSFWKIYLIDCLIWPPLQFINFTYIKKEYQPIYVNVLNIFWNTFLSLCLAVSH